MGIYKGLEVVEGRLVPIKFAEKMEMLISPQGMTAVPPPPAWVRGAEVRVRFRCFHFNTDIGGGDDMRWTSALTV